MQTHVQHGRRQPSWQPADPFLPNHVFSDNRSSIVWEQFPFQLLNLLQASLVRVKMALKTCKLLQFCCYNMNLWPSWHVYPSQREGSLLCSSLSGFFFCLLWVFFYPFWVEGVSSALNVRQTVIVNFGCTYVIWLIDYLIDRLTPPQGVIHSAPWSDIP